MAEESEEPSDGMTQPSREKPQWGKKLSQKCKAAWRRCKDSLFGAIAIWAVLGIIAFVLAMWGLGRVPVWQLKLDPEKQAESIVKIALTLVGGVGAVAYLVIKYQEQQQAGRAEKREKDRIVDTKMQDAINQLGSDKASTRIAGVYALTDIADTYRGGYRQRVVDILCGYLRSDRETYPLGEDGKPATGLPRSGDADKAVESTILSMFVAHLKKGPRDENGDVTLRQQVRNDQLWCDCSFDLHGATFHEDVRLIGTTFEHGLNFQGTKFERGANFSGAHFTGGASFSGAHFTGGADFGGADLDGANFSGAHFTGGADFGGADLDGANFSGAHFTGDANFNVADLDGANFSGAHFTGGANFVMAEFRTSAVFSGIQGQPSFRFEECKFNKIFRGAYEWGPIPIPEDNDGLPAGAVWKDFLGEALKDKDFLELWRNLNKCLKEYGKDGGTTNR